MSKTFDLTLIPLYRVGGDELPIQPGLLALTPPRRKARSRARDLLIIHLSLGGNASLSISSFHQMTSAAAEEFYKSSGSVTAALRATATTINGNLLEKNMTSSGQGRYSLANLILGVVRGESFYVLESGPGHVYWMANGERRDIHNPDMAGRGLGLGQTTNFYLSQFTLCAGGRLLISPTLSAGWEKILERDNQSASLETLRSVLMRQSMEDQNAFLVEVQPGRGEITMLKPPRPHKPTYASVSKKIAEEPLIESHQPEPQMVETEALREKDSVAAPSLDNESKIPQERPILDAIPEQKPEPIPAFEEERSILDSLPRLKPEPIPVLEEESPAFESIPDQAPEPIEEVYEEEIPTGPPIGEILVRQSARTLAKGMQVTREGNNKLKDFTRKMMPRLLPADDPNTPFQMPNWIMALIAVIIPLVVVTIASVVYFRFGRDLQYETAYAEVEAARARAFEQNDPIAERVAWENLLSKLNIAEKYDSTSEIDSLRAEAQHHLDALLGIIRLDFQPAITDLPRNLNISAMVVTDTEFFILDSVNGEILRAFLTGDGYQYDSNFNCRSGDYGGTSVGALVALEALPKTNAMAASVMGVDAQGNLIYCAANQVPQASSLYSPPVGLKNITAISLDGDVLYLLDAPSREVWVYGGRSAAFIDYPTAFFENIPQGMENAVDMSVKGNDLYLLFNDGHLASCTYSLLDTVPTRCTNPVQLIDPHPAAGGGNSFREDIFTEMLISTPPDPALLLLAPEIQAVYRFSPRSFSLQNQLHSIGGNFSNEPLTAMASSPSHVLFLAQGDEVYRVADTP